MNLNINLTKLELTQLTPCRHVTKTHNTIDATRTVPLKLTTKKLLT